MENKIINGVEYEWHTITIPLNRLKLPRKIKKKSKKFFYELSKLSSNNSIN
jgi:hypothetical protein